MCWYNWSYGNFRHQVSFQVYWKVHMYAKKGSCSGRLWKVIQENYCSSIVEAFNVFLKINLRCFEALVLLWNSCSFSFWKNWKENLSNFSALPQVKLILLSQKDRKGCIYYVEKRKILFQTKLKWRDSCFHRITQVILWKNHRKRLLR